MVLQRLLAEALTNSEKKEPPALESVAVCLNHEYLAFYSSCLHRMPAAKNVMCLEGPLYSAEMME